MSICPDKSFSVTKAVWMADAELAEGQLACAISIWCCGV